MSAMRLRAAPPDDTLRAAVLEVQERVRAWLRDRRHIAAGPARPGVRSMPVDEVIEIALACLAVLASSGSTGAADLADRIGFAASGVDRAGAASPSRLTTRERESIRLVAAGLSNKQIAHALHITQRTVKMHIASAMTKLGAANRAHAAVLATQMSLL